LLFIALLFIALGTKNLLDQILGGLNVVNSTRGNLTFQTTPLVSCLSCIPPNGP